MGAILSISADTTRRAKPPRFPVQLFNALAGMSPRRALAWDCAAGHGSVALALAGFFRRVVASDASLAAIAAAPGHPRVHYVVGRAETTCLSTGSVDLVVVAQALHWLDMEAFYTEAHRVLRPHGAIAAWCYGDCTVQSEIDFELDRLRTKVGDYWGPERDLVVSRYANVPFPFEEVSIPRQHLLVRWTLQEMLWHVRTWQATRAYLACNGEEAAGALFAPLVGVWGNPAWPRAVVWPIYLRAGHNWAAHQG